MRSAETIGLDPDGSVGACERAAVYELGSRSGSRPCSTAPFGRDEALGLGKRENASRGVLEFCAVLELVVNDAEVAQTEEHQQRVDVDPIARWPETVIASTRSARYHFAPFGMTAWQRT